MSRSLKINTVIDNLKWNLFINLGWIRIQNNKYIELKWIWNSKNTWIGSFTNRRAKWTLKIVSWFGTWVGSNQNWNTKRK